MSRAEVMIAGKMLQSHAGGYGKGEVPLTPGQLPFLLKHEERRGSTVFRFNLRHVLFIACVLLTITQP